MACKSHCAADDLLGPPTGVCAADWCFHSAPQRVGCTGPAGPGLFGLYVAGIGGALVVAWYVFAPQCLSTLATIKRETGGWTMSLIAAGYLFGLAYLASFVTYRGALAMGGG